MKFKSIYIFFSVTLFFLLSILILLPRLFPVSGTGSSIVDFWHFYWLLITLWFMLFSVVNLLYFLNRKLFSLIEMENWPALIRYLENRIIQKGRYSSRLVRLLANTYMELSDTAGVMNLENICGIVKPSVVDENVLIFGLARILSRDISGAVRFYQSRREQANPQIRDWVYWYYAFSLVMAKEYILAGNEFKILARMSKNVFITALSSYFLDEVLSHVLPDLYTEYKDISHTSRLRVLKVLPNMESWKKELLPYSGEVYISAIEKYTDKTMKWLYG